MLTSLPECIYFSQCPPMPVFFRENGSDAFGPSDADSGVIPCESAFCLRSIKGRDFVVTFGVVS